MINTSVLDTFRELQQRNSDSKWLWSMMLTRGLSWDNVWELFPKGVAGPDRTNLYRDAIGKVPGLDYLLSLPDGPKTALDIFHKVLEVRQHTFESGHFDLNTQTIAKGFWNIFDSVSYKWHDVKAVLDASNKLYEEIWKSGDGSADEALNVLHDVMEMFRIVEDKNPTLISRMVHYAMATQHPVVSDHRYDALVRKLGDNDIEQLWDHLRGQQWRSIESVVNVFLTLNGRMKAHTSERRSLEQLDVVQKHPQLLDTAVVNCLTANVRKHLSNAYFLPLSALLENKPSWYALFHANMNRELTLDNFNTVFSNHNSRTTIKDVVLAYQQMPVSQRDSKEGLLSFAHVLGNMDIGIQGYMTNHATERIKQQIEQAAQGSLAKIFALHACVRGLFKQTLVDKEVKEFRNIFHHDPRSKTGLASIVRKHIPEFKEWLPMVQSLGLSEDEVWKSGLQKLCQHQAPEFEVNDAIFEFQ